MVEHLTSWPMVKAIPDKEPTTVENVIFENLIFEHGVQKSFCLIMGKNSQMTLWPMSARSLGLSSISFPHMFPGQIARQIISLVPQGLNKKIVSRRQSFMESST